MWDLIVSVPDHCIAYLFTSCMARFGHKLNYVIML